MHNSAYKNAERFYLQYCSNNIEDKIVLDIGSYDANGTLKPIFEKSRQYIGLDQSSGPNVDIVSSSHNIMLPENYFDIIVSSSCFEHDDMFWVTFLEMSKLLKEGGYIYINAPSNGPYHAYPVDNWRFYKDSWKALEKWAIKNGHDIKLIEHYIDPDNMGGPWNDSVGIYTKYGNKVSDIYKKINCTSDKDSVGYIEFFYDDFFANKKYKNILEIGCRDGESIRLWENVFTDANIFAVDIRDFTNPKRAKKIIGDAYSESVYSQFGDNSLDLVIDDGPHTYGSFISLINNYYSKIKVGGTLIIEDIIRPMGNMGVTESQQIELIKLAKRIGYKNIKEYNMTSRPKTQELKELWKSGLFILTLEK